MKMFPWDQAQASSATVAAQRSKNAEPVVDDVDANGVEKGDNWRRLKKLRETRGGKKKKEEKEKKRERKKIKKYAETAWERGEQSGDQQPIILC